MQAEHREFGNIDKKLRFSSYFKDVSLYLFQTFPYKYLIGNGLYTKKRGMILVGVFIEINCARFVFYKKK